MPKPTKPALADALWPILKRKIDDAELSDDSEVPVVAEVVHEAYLLARDALGWRSVVRCRDFVDRAFLAQLNVVPRQDCKGNAPRRLGSA